MDMSATWDQNLNPSEKRKARLVYGMLKGVARLPLGALYGLSDLVAFILHRCVKYRRDMIRHNLRQSFPEASEEKINRWVKEFYSHFCDVFVEAAKLAHISDKEIDRRIKYEGLEKVNEVMSQGKSVVLLLGHFGNWEWVTSAARKFIPGVVSCEIYHPLSDKVFDAVMLRLRSRFGTENIPMASTVRRLIAIRNEGKQWICGFISDQRPFTPELKHWTTFMNQDTPYVNGGEVIGKKMGAEFFYVEMMPEKRGHYKMTFERLQPEDDGEENPVTRDFLRHLERSIRKNPPAWLWSHNRWKRKR